MNIKLFYKIATVLNALDLTTSYVGFYFLSGVELNAWRHLINNNYLACLIAVVLYQLIITAMYFIAVRFKMAEKPFIVWSMIKVFVVVWNITQFI
jgi:FlaA1/EpsC-like NDP-sugar epimerase